MKALILIDIQNDFLPGGALAVPQGDEIIPIVNALQNSFSLVVATKDWHPRNHISFASTHKKKIGEVLEKEGKTQELWPDHCIQGTFGAEHPQALDQTKIRKTFFKGNDPNIDSYSAFFDNGHLYSTGLGEYLQSLEVDEIYIAGLATEYCVKYTVLDAQKYHLKVCVMIEACRGIELHPGDISRAIEEMRASGALLLTGNMCPK